MSAFSEKLRSLDWFSLLGTLYFVGMELLLLHYAGSAWQEWWHLRYHRAEAEGRVLELQARWESDSDGNSQLNHYAAYQFLPMEGGRSQTREEKIDEDRFNGLHPGAGIPVYYSTLDPSINRLSPTGLFTLILLTGITLGWTALCGWLLWWIYKER